MRITGYNEWPLWAQPRGPILGYILRRVTVPAPCWARTVGGLLALSFVTSLLLVSLVLYDNGSFDDLFAEDEPGLFIVLYPLLALFEFGAVIGAMGQVAMLGLTAPGASDDDQRQTWEMAKVTSAGADLVTRARWAALLYRMRLTLILLVAARLMFAAQAAIEGLTFWETYGPALEDAHAVPPSWMAVGLLGLLAGTLVIMPPVVVGFSAALGLWLSTFFRRRWMLQIAQQVVFYTLLIVGTLSMIAGWSALDGSFQERFGSGLKAQGAVLLMCVTGDQGMRLLNAEALVTMATGVDYGAWLSVPLLAAAGGLLFATRRLMRWAAGRAARAGRE